MLVNWVTLLFAFVFCLNSHWLNLNLYFFISRTALQVLNGCAAARAANDRENVKPTKQLSI